MFLKVVLVGVMGTMIWSGIEISLNDRGRKWFWDWEFIQSKLYYIKFGYVWVGRLLGAEIWCVTAWIDFYTGFVIRDSENGIQSLYDIVFQNKHLMGEKWSVYFLQWNLSRGIGLTSVSHHIRAEVLTELGYVLQKDVWGFRHELYDLGLAHGPWGL